MKPGSGIIIVSGSSGRIGDGVMRRLAPRFEDIIGFDREAPTPPAPHCVYVPVEITSDESVRDGLRAIREHHGAHVASVIHLAAYTTSSAGRARSTTRSRCELRPRWIRIHHGHRTRQTRGQPD